MLLNVQWFKIQSWHIYKFTTRGGQPVSVCGREGDRTAPVVEDRPGDQRTCESCLRIAGPR